jgi:excisionase family DNA binding protein
VLGGLLGASEDGSFNVKTSWIYEAVRAGRLPYHRVGRHIRFMRPMLDDWLAEQSKL